MRVTFWGTRGTSPATGAEYARYGGDTMCVEVECEDTRIVLDAGSGLRKLGLKLAASSAPATVHILLSHLHLDHIMGLPLFAPLWRKDARVIVHVPEECAAEGLDRTLLTVLTPPLSPVAADRLPADFEVRSFRSGSSIALSPGVWAHTFALAHQGASVGIAVEAGGKKLCYVTDHEHGDEKVDTRVANAAAGADLLIYDATFTDAEWPQRRGWGHSTWEEGLRVQDRSAARLLALAHHDPDRDDAALDALGEAASARRSNVFFAKQGLQLTL